MHISNSDSILCISALLLSLSLHLFSVSLALSLTHFCSPPIVGMLNRCGVFFPRFLFSWKKKKHLLLNFALQNKCLFCPQYAMDEKSKENGLHQCKLRTVFSAQQWMLISQDARESAHTVKKIDREQDGDEALNNENELWLWSVCNGQCIAKNVHFSLSFYLCLSLSSFFPEKECWCESSPVRKHCIVCCLCSPVCTFLFSLFFHNCFFFSRCCCEYVLHRVQECEFFCPSLFHK